MRFGLSDLEELPSLREFEHLAQAALGSDDGIASIEPEDATQTDSGGEIAATAELSADAREAVVEGESSDSSGEQSAEVELGGSPAESAAEVFDDSGEPISDSQAKGTSA
jgi:hypothetical protein